MGSKRLWWGWPGVALAAVLVAFAGCSGGVSAAAYFKAACPAVTSYEDTVQQQTRSLSASLGAGTTPAQGKSALVTYLDRVTTATDDLIAKLKKAGVPGMSGGDGATKLIDALTALRDAFAKGKSDAEQVSTTSATAFQQDVTNIQSEINSAASGLQAATRNLRSGEMDKAEAAEPSCSGLSGG
jgi:hypothetical protein